MGSISSLTEGVSQSVFRLVNLSGFRQRGLMSLLCKDYLSLCVGDTMPKIELDKTPLEMLHKEHGATMVEFAGYSMPLQYQLGIKGEHLHTRSKAGLFDVSHMGQIRLKGVSVFKDLESLVPSDLQGLEVGAMRYTVFTNESGGILDDLIVTRGDGYALLVLNAASKAAGLELLRKNLDCEIELMTGSALLALQGPGSVKILNELVPGVEKLFFLQSAEFTFLGSPITVSRSGYTGEDGFEVSIPKSDVRKFAEILLNDPDVALVGLGARDALRLEAGLCLYGQDLSKDVTPVEASLSWVISKRRREEGNFPGFGPIKEQLVSGIKKRRVGILPLGKAPARAGCEIILDGGRKIGSITSGGYSPTLERPIAMGYVEELFSKIGTEVLLLVRGKYLPAKIVDLPFVNTKYFRQ